MTLNTINGVVLSNNVYGIGSLLEVREMPSLRAILHTRPRGRDHTIRISRGHGHWSEHSDQEKSTSFLNILANMKQCTTDLAHDVVFSYDN